MIRFTKDTPKGEYVASILEITMPNGDVFDINDEYILDKMAKHYSKADNISYDESYAELINDTDAVIDWVKNNMNWSDIEQNSFVSYIAKPNYENMFSESEIRYKDN